MKKHRTFLRLVFVLALFCAAFSIIMRWWIPAGIAVVIAFAVLWILMD